MNDGPPEGLHDAIEASQDGNARLEQSVLVGWVVVAEWAGADGARTLTRMSGTPGGAVPPECRPVATSTRRCSGSGTRNPESVVGRLVTSKG